MVRHCRAQRTAGVGARCHGPGRQSRAAESGAGSQGALWGRGHGVRTIRCCGIRWHRTVSPALPVGRRPACDALGHSGEQDNASLSSELRVHRTRVLDKGLQAEGAMKGPPQKVTGEPTLQLEQERACQAEK